MIISRKKHTRLLRYKKLLKKRGLLKRNLKRDFINKRIIRLNKDSFQLYKKTLKLQTKTNKIKRRFKRRIKKRNIFLYKRNKVLTKQFQKFRKVNHPRRFKRLFVTKSKQYRRKIFAKKKRYSVKRRQRVSRLIKRTIFRLNIRQTKNNMFMTYLTEKGSVLYSLSCGCIGLDGPRRSTPFAAEQLGRLFGFKLSRIARFKKTFIILKTGLTRHVRGCITFLSRSFRSFRGIVDLIPRPHNGLRPRKLRRL